jgi:hypothetical protein
VATILDTYMTLIKKKITEVESIVNKADNRKTAGKVYLPKEWIGKKSKDSITIVVNNHDFCSIDDVTNSSNSKKTTADSSS